MISGGLETVRRFHPTFIIEATGLHFSDAARNPFEVLRSLGYGLWDIGGQHALTLDGVRERLSEDDPSFSINLIAKAQQSR